MNKTSKIVLSFVLCLSIVFYFPVSSKASGFTLECKTITSVDGYYSNADIQLMQKRLTGYNPSLANRSISDIENALSSFVPLGGNWSKYFITYWASEDFLLVEEFDTSKIHEGIFLCANNDSLPASNVDLNNRPATTRLNVQVLFGGEYRRESTFNFSNSSWSSSYTTSSPTFVNALIQPTLYIDGNIPMYCKWDIIQSGGSYSEDLTFYLSDKSAYTNFLSRDLPYETSSGSVVDPSPEVVIEGNNNHMYFNGCEIGFCEPYNQNNFSNYGGAYVYIRYQVDDWVVNHISDYSLDIQLLKVVGSTQETYSKSVLLDRDGCVEIPLSDFSREGTAVPNSGFDVAVVNNIVEDNYYKSYLYCVQGDLANFVSKNSGVDVTSHTYNNPWGSLKDGVLSSIYFYQVTTETYNLMDNQALQAAIAARQTYNPYIFRVQVNLVSGEDRSGDIATKFDLVTGDQSDISTSGFVNPDPFIPDTSDPNFLPSVPGDNSTTPSTIVYTGGTFTGNFNGVIGFDPGYRQLKQDIDADPDGNFTQYLAPFENNEVGGFVGDFLDDMPTALKSIFIGGFGVLTLLGIYRFIRRG